MSGQYAYLPCNGLDKPLGPLTRELALRLLSEVGGDVICPVLLARSRSRYAKTLSALPVWAIDGCATRCASRLAADLGLALARRVQLAEELKAAGSEIENSLTPGPQGLALVQAVARRLLAQSVPSARPQVGGQEDFTAPVAYLTFSHDKFVFRVPAEGYYFNENDCWVRIGGDRGRVGISDFMQQSLSDILFFNPVALGSEVAQFGELGTVESSKATFEVVAPVSGKVVAVNQAAVDAPELINEDPYERGWLVELEPADFAAEQELLLAGPQYLEHLKRKAADYRPRNGRQE